MELTFTYIICDAMLFVPFYHLTVTLEVFA